ncbi:MAG: helix-turn-helix transcriptional regulator [Syntrophomonadaceae bacterium]|nr:helix-turn-helix transcriptional regulator [Syntrophomonadaceae bacterium]
METIGERIRARREQLAWTQAKLAEMLNVKIGTVSGYERNYRVPDARMLQLLAGVLEVSSDYLLGLAKSEHVSKHDYLHVEDMSDWMEILELTAESGLTALQVKQILLNYIETARNIKNLK